MHFLLVCKHFVLFRMDDYSHAGYHLFHIGMPSDTIETIDCSKFVDG